MRNALCFLNRVNQFSKRIDVIVQLIPLSNLGVLSQLDI